jgi:hypothetical protein
VGTFCNVAKERSAGGDRSHKGETMKPNTTQVLLLAALLAIPVARPAQARSVISQPWQGLVLAADFVAEVECTVAGGIVAKYRVVTIWKGPEKPGDEIRLEISPDESGPQFPLALVGQRFIVAAHRPSPTDGHANSPCVPLFLRQLNATYRTPLTQGMSHINPGEEDRPCQIFNVDFTSVAAFGEGVQYLLRLPAPVQEKLELDARLSALRNSTVEPYRDAVEVFDNSRTVDDAVDALQLLGTQQAKNIIRQIELFRTSKIAAAQPQPPAAARKSKAPLVTEDEIQAAIKLLGSDKPIEVYDAIEQLAAARPAAVVGYLLSWQNLDPRWPQVGYTYALGSYFCHLCPAAGRQALLTRLTAATDPGIQVAAAVYLAFDDLPAATVKLREFSQLPGDPGAWAAITLARRGNQDALPRAMRIFDSPGKSDMQSAFHRNLQKQLLVLLSNSAAASRIRQPPAPPKEDDAFPGLADWYRQNAGKLKLIDVWADELAQVRAD